MTCADALETLLDADPSVLRGEEGEHTPLGRHLRTCARCRSAAEIILREEALLADGLTGSTAPLDVERLMSQGVDSTAVQPRVSASSPGRRSTPEEPRARPDASASSRSIRRPGQRRFPSWTLSAIPVAAAAILATLLLTHTPDLPGTRYEPPTEFGGLDVAVPEERTAAVLITDDPDITVVWVF
jgi:hypothetical protein